MKDIIDDTDEQSDEDVHKIMSGRVPSAGVLLPHLPAVLMHSPIWTLFNPYCLGG